MGQIQDCHVMYTNSTAVQWTQLVWRARKRAMGPLLELAIVATPHRNRPVASVPVVNPQLADLAASASD